MWFTVTVGRVHSHFPIAVRADVADPAHLWPINRGISQSRLSIVGMNIRVRLSVGLESPSQAHFPRLCKK